MDKQLRQSLSYIKKNFIRINWIQTIWFNLSVLPFKDAIRIPFLLSYNVVIKRIGTIKLESKPLPGMIKIGLPRINTDMIKEPILISNNGTIIFQGFAKIHMGVKLNIRGGEVIFGNRTTIGNCTKIVCMKKIQTGENTRISWNCQLYDTDFHFLYNAESKKYYNRVKPIIIGNNVFVGNGCTMAKGTTLPDGCVISCCTKISGDFSTFGNNLLIKGDTGKVVKTGVQMTSGWFPELEKQIEALVNE